MKNTASNANSAGWISNGFDKRTMPCEDFPGQKELLNPFKRDGRTISPDPDLGGCSILSRVYAGMMPPLRTLKIANSAILSYNPRNLLEKRFQTRNRITYHDLQKKIFLATQDHSLGSLISGYSTGAGRQASHRSSRTVRRRVIPGTFRQPERQLSKG